MIDDRYRVQQPTPDGVVKGGSEMEKKNAQRAPGEVQRKERDYD